MTERNITPGRVVEALKYGIVSAGNKINTTVYQLGSKDSVSGRGVKVVIDIANEIRTVIDKGSKFAPKE